MPLFGRPRARSTCLPLPAALLLGLLALLAGCGDMGDAPAAPGAPAGPSMVGSVALVAHLTDETGSPLGTERIREANGVRVYCRHDKGEVETVATVAGRFVFRGIPAGVCTVYVMGPDARRADEAPFSMPDHDCSLTRTLEVAPAGDLTVYPNPVPAAGAAIEFSKSTSEPYRVSILDLAGEVVWSYEQAAPPGHYHVHWIGTDQAGEPVGPGAYWVRVDRDGSAAYDIALAGGGEGTPGDAPCGHVHADGVAFLEDERLLAIQTDDRVDGEIAVTVGGELSARLRFVDEDGSLFAIPDTCAENSLEWEVADTSIAQVLPEPGTKWGIRVSGRAPGLTTALFRVIHEEHTHLITLPFPIRVGD